MMTDADFIREVQSCERTLYRVSRTILSSDADCCEYQSMQEKLPVVKDSVMAARFSVYFL